MVFSNCIASSPLTGAKDFRAIHIYEVKNLIEGWRKSFNIDIADEMRGIEEIILYECNQTRLKFFFPSDAAGSVDIYEQLQNCKWYYMSNKWEFDISLKILSKSNRILEIGSAFGSFIEAGHRAGLTAIGIELNESAVRVAKDRGLPVEKADLHLYAKENPESFDALCSFQVLEHVPDPKKFIRSSLKILKKNGLLLLSVPNSESFLKYQYNLLDLPPHHMTRWCKAAFLSLEGIFPIKLEKIYYEPLAEYHVSAYLDAYARHYKSLFKTSRCFFNRFTAPILIKLINLKDIRRFFRGQTILAQFRKYE